MIFWERRKYGWLGKRSGWNVWLKRLHDTTRLTPCHEDGTCAMKSRPMKWNQRIRWCDTMVSETHEISNNETKILRKQQLKNPNSRRDLKLNEMKKHRDSTKRTANIVPLMTPYRKDLNIRAFTLSFGTHSSLSQIELVTCCRARSDVSTWGTTEGSSFFYFRRSKLSLFVIKSPMAKWFLNAFW